MRSLLCVSHMGYNTCRSLSTPSRHNPFRDPMISHHDIIGPYAHNYIHTYIHRHMYAYMGYRGFTKAVLLRVVVVPVLGSEGLVGLFPGSVFSDLLLHIFFSCNFPIRNAKAYLDPPTTLYSGTHHVALSPHCGYCEGPVTDMFCEIAVQRWNQFWAEGRSCSQRAPVGMWHIRVGPPISNPAHPQHPATQVRATTAATTPKASAFAGCSFPGIWYNMKHSKIPKMTVGNPEAC